MSNATPPNFESLAQWLHDRRDSRGLAMRDLSAATGIDHSLLSRYESGERVPTADQVDRLAAHFGEAAAAAQVLRLKDTILHKYADDPAMPDAIALIAEEAGTYVTKAPTANGRQ